MSDFIEEVLGFLVEAGASIADLLVLSLGFVVDAAVILHTEMPRLEGLLVGVLLAWAMSKRDKHPVIKAIGAPLKIVLDILDLAAEKGSSLLKRGTAFVFGWVKRPFAFIFDKAKAAYDKLIKKLGEIKEFLSK
tara:strand:- start:1009 stop:1410 length:402 start_codon:yes stop_codon:yes gene_type:complete